MVVQFPRSYFAATEISPFNQSVAIGANGVAHVLAAFMFAIVLAEGRVIDRRPGVLQVRRQTGSVNEVRLVDSRQIAERWEQVEELS